MCQLEFSSGQFQESPATIPAIEQVFLPVEEQVFHPAQGQVLLPAEEQVFLPAQEQVFHPAPTDGGEQVMYSDIATRTGPSVLEQYSRVKKLAPIVLEPTGRVSDNSGAATTGTRTAGSQTDSQNHLRTAEPHNQHSLRTVAVGSENQTTMHTTSTEAIPPEPSEEQILEHPKAVISAQNLAKQRDENQTSAVTSALNQIAAAESQAKRLSDDGQEARDLEMVRLGHPSVQEERLGHPVSDGRPPADVGRIKTESLANSSQPRNGRNTKSLESRLV